MAIHLLVLLHGSTHPLPKPVPLQAGKLNILYESGFLRHIRIGDIEGLRMINYYLRDQNWGTVPMTITDEKIEKNEKSFSISYAARSLQDDIHFQWSCTIIGNEDSTITFDIEGKALTSFKRNRLGFTVLHPIENCTGKECTIVHPDQSNEVLKFPEKISPFQPFFEITGMQWNPAEGIEASIHFDGEVFETEDQRNWIDASYKTYCTPLAKPFPVLVQEGDTVRQTIRFGLTTDLVPQYSPETEINIAVDKSRQTNFPSVGIPLSNLSYSREMIKQIQELGIDFLRIEIHTVDHQGTTEMLRRAVEVKMPLQIVLFIKKDSGLDFIDSLLPLIDQIKHLIILPEDSKCTNADLITDVVPLLRSKFPMATIGGGTDAFFTELNRDRTPATDLDFLSFSINPQVHAFDILSMTENLAAIQDVVESCRAFTDGKEVYVGPVTLKMRWNPNATEKEEVLMPDTLPDRVDPRQLSLFGAAWLLGSFKYIAENGVKAVTYFETFGWNGLLPHEDQPWPAEFGFPRTAVYPMYVVLKHLLMNKDCKIAKLKSGNPLKVDGLALIDPEGMTTLMLANFSNQDQFVMIPSSLGMTKSWCLDETNTLDCILDYKGFNPVYSEMKKEIVLRPFSIMFMK